MKVTESHSKESYRDGFVGYGWKSRYQLQVDYDAFNPLNTKAAKIVEDIIRDNKGRSSAKTILEMMIGSYTLPT